MLLNIIDRIVKIYIIFISFYARVFLRILFIFDYDDSRHRCPWALKWICNIEQVQDAELKLKGMPLRFWKWENPQKPNGNNGFKSAKGKKQAAIHIWT